MESPFKVLHARRFNKRNRTEPKKDNEFKWILSRSVVITFSGQILPSEVYIHKVRFSIEPYMTLQFILIASNTTTQIKYTIIIWNVLCVARKSMRMDIQEIPLLILIVTGSIDQPIGTIRSSLKNTKWESQWHIAMRILQWMMSES